MVLLFFFDKYQEVSRNFKTKMQQVLELFQRDWTEFHGYLKVFGVMRGDKPISIFQQKKEIAHKPMDILGELVDKFAPLIDADLTFSKGFSANDTLYPLMVQGEHFGSFTLSQLYFLLQRLTGNEIDLVYKAIPTNYPNQVWKRSDQEGVREMESEIPAAMRQFKPDKQSWLSILLEPNGDVPLVDLTTAEVLHCTIFSATLPREYKAEIAERRQVLIRAVEDSIDKASLIEVEPVNDIGKRILNFIHFGDSKGMEYFPF